MPRGDTSHRNPVDLKKCWVDGGWVSVGYMVLIVANNGLIMNYTGKIALRMDSND